MSKLMQVNKPRRIAAERLFNRPWAISQAALAALVAEFQIGAWQGDDDEEEEPQHDFPVTEDGIACIPVSGVLTKANYWWSTCYAELRESFAKAFNDPAVKAILAIYNSPGGEACSELLDLGDYLYSMRGVKPMAAVSDDQCYSAAYWLGATADRVGVTRMGGVGSVGCWMAHVDLSGMLDKEGIKVTYVFSGAKKVDGNSYEPLSDRAKADMQAESDRCRDLFVAAVSRDRGASADAIYATEAGCLMAANALPLLADAVWSIDEALGYLRGRIASADTGAAPEMEDVGDEGESLPVEVEAHSFLRANGKSSALLCYSGAIDYTVSCDRDLVLTADFSKLFFGVSGVVEATRTIPGCVAALSGQADSPRRISMLLVPYDGALSTNLGGFREIYQRGAFAEGLDSDPHVLFDHDESRVLGRKSAGTATFWEDAAGVHVECDAPETTWASDLLVSMRRKDITRASACFWILKAHWETRGSERVRVVEKALLREGSVKSFAAYETTQATVQPAAETEQQHVVTELDRARLELLTRR